MCAYIYIAQRFYFLSDRQKSALKRLFGKITDMSLYFCAERIKIMLLYVTVFCAIIVTESGAVGDDAKCGALALML